MKNDQIEVPGYRTLVKNHTWIDPQYGERYVEGDENKKFKMLQIARYNTPSLEKVEEIIKKICKGEVKSELPASRLEDLEETIESIGKDNFKENSEFWEFMKRYKDWNLSSLCVVPETFLQARRGIAPGSTLRGFEEISKQPDAPPELKVPDDVGYEDVLLTRGERIERATIKLQKGRLYNKKEICHKSLEQLEEEILFGQFESDDSREEFVNLIYSLFQSKEKINLLKDYSEARLCMSTKKLLREVFKRSIFKRATDCYPLF